MITHKMIKGPRGGYYWLDENGKKHYVKGKEAKTKVAKKATPESKFQAKHILKNATN